MTWLIAWLVTWSVSRRRHDAELQRVFGDHREQVARLQRVADRVARRRAATWLDGVAKSYRLDAEHPTSGKAHTAPSQQGLTPEERLVVQHELETVARDILKEI